MPSTFNATCPHCHAEHMTFRLFGVASPGAELPVGRMPYVSAAADCPGCGNPVAIQMMLMLGEQDPREIIKRASELKTRDDDVTQVAMGIKHIWPQPQATVIPANMSADVERAFTQAERNYQMAGCEEPAALMYRRSLELALKDLHPGVSGSLADRIRKLVDQHELPKPMGEWLTHARLIGNDGAHEPAGVTREALDDARAFADTTLRYLYTLPAQIEARQKLKQNT